tara:strand:+ start:400 stop:849 length:450 start_codon:yes stop_codon:yes gene_type:complete
MNFFKIIFILLFTLINSLALADSHDQKQEVLDKVNEIAKELENEEEVPLNDPFAGNEGTSSMSGNIPADEQENEFSLYNFKLAGLISGKDHSYISIVNSGGEVLTLTLGQFLGKIQLVDLRLTEAIFKKEDGKFMIIDFNNQVREADDY